MIYFGVFTAGLLTGMQVDWESWFWGVAFGLSVAKVAWHVLGGSANE